MPATAFKAAIVAGARHFDGVPMTLLKQALFVDGEGPDQLVKLHAGEAQMREDMVRNETGVADIRYRPSFWPWAATLRVTYLSSVITKESVLALIDAGGNAGIGEWRPSSKKALNGAYGMFEVDAEE